MSRKKPPSRTKLDQAAAAFWKSAYQTSEGHAAIGLLFTEFNIYHSDPSNDPNAALRAQGQRDVLLRITQLIGMRPEHFPQDAWETSDTLTSILGS